MSRQIELHVEELVLDGLRSVNRRRLGHAVEGELVRLLTANGLPPVGRDRSANTIDAGTFALGEIDARSLGEQVAASVYRSLER